jgi:hypothetical protein
MQRTAHLWRVSCLGLTIEKIIISYFFRKVKSNALSAVPQGGFSEFLSFKCEQTGKTFIEISSIFTC